MMCHSPWNFLLTSMIFVMSHDYVTSHGRLILPPSRSSAWRYGFKVPENFNDNELNCGGYANQWEKQGGKCGVCGDPYQGPHHNEAPDGKYAKGVIVGEYKAGGIISVKVDITKNHKGWHEFSLCVKDDPKEKVTQSCLDKHLLPLADGSGTTRYFMPDTQDRIYDLELKLPEDIECSGCVFQWKWNCGNSWGTDPDSSSGIGKGAQEQFYGCADIRIINKKTTTTKYTSTTPKSMMTERTTPKSHKTTQQLEECHGCDDHTKENVALTTPKTVRTTMPEVCHGCDVNTKETIIGTLATTTKTNGVTTSKYDSSEKPNIPLTCTPTAVWIMIPGMTEWCYNNCNGYTTSCPESHCTCKPVG